MIRTKEVMQTMRIAKHPFLSDASQDYTNLIVVDELESGILKIYEHTGEAALQIQQLFTELDCWPGAAMVAKTVIRQPERKDSVIIESIFCEYGYKELAASMIYQVLNFAEFYDCIRAVTISGSEREKWFLYAGGILADFMDRDDCYEYRIIR